MNFKVGKIMLLDSGLASITGLSSSVDIAKNSIDLAEAFTFEAYFTHQHWCQISFVAVIGEAAFNEIINTSFESQQLFYSGFELQKDSDSDLDCFIIEFAIISTEPSPFDLSKIAVVLKQWHLKFAILAVEKLMEFELRKY